MIVSIHYEMNKEWKHFKTLGDGEYFEIDGINIWDYKWESDYKKIFVKDPHYDQKHSFHRFWINLLNKKVEFVAGEFSNCIWGIYIRSENGLKINNNRKIYNQIKEFLDEFFPENHIESMQYEDCFHVIIDLKEKGKPSIWFEFDIGNSELIVGYENVHIHYGKQYGIKITEGLNRLLDFFTSKIKKTDFYKGKRNFKSVYEIKNENGAYEDIGVSSKLFLYPFWEKTTKKVTEHSEIIKDENMKIQLEKIRNRINNVC